MTGFYRDGYCRVGPEDKGNHAIAGESHVLCCRYSLSFCCFRLLDHLHMILWPISISRGLADFVFLFTAVVTDEFLDFSASRGNDLRQIPGMKGGCKWCLCTNRWKEAVDARKSDDDPVVPKYVFVLYPSPAPPSTLA